MLDNNKKKVFIQTKEKKKLSNYSRKVKPRAVYMCSVTHHDYNEN